MSGNKSTISQQESRLGSINIQQSSYGLVLPLVYGRQRIPGNLIWYGDFTAIATTTTTQTGGKGGGGVRQENTTYTYEAAVMMGLADGVLSRVRTVWRDKERYEGGFVTPDPVQEDEINTFSATPVTVFKSGKYLATVRLYIAAVSEDEQDTELSSGVHYSVDAGVYTFNTTDYPDMIGKQVHIMYLWREPIYWVDALGRIGLTLVTGKIGQPVWSWLETKHPDQAIGYSGVSYVCGAAYQLTTNAGIYNHNFEVDGACQISDEDPDAWPKDVVEDFLTNTCHGAGFPASKISDLSIYDAYTKAAGIKISPFFAEQRQAREHLDSVMTMTNSAPVWSEGKLKIIPYGDEEISGNGATYTPNLTPVYDLTDDDFIPETEGDDPVTVHIKTSADAYNKVQIEYLNRENYYATEIMPADDLAHIELDGLRTQDPVEMHGICNPDVARNVAQLVLQRSLYIRDEYTFRLGWKFILLEPMDIVTLTDEGAGLNRTPVRITSIEETEDGVLLITAEDFPVGVAAAPLYSSQYGSGFSANYNVDPGDVEPPVFISPTSALSGANLSIWCAVTGSSGYWGGCHIWASYDNATYQKIGTLYGGARYGALVADVGEAGNSVSVALVGQGGQLLSGTANDASLFNTLCWMGNQRGGEFFAYENSSLASENAYTLTNLNRGGYGTSAAGHAKGDQFARLDQAIFRGEALSENLRGKPVWFKFQSFNCFNAGTQAIEDLTAYKYTIGGGTETNPGTQVTASGDLSVAVTITSRDTCIIQVDDETGATNVMGYQLRIKDADAWAECTFIGWDQDKTFEIKFSSFVGKTLAVRAAYNDGNGYSTTEAVIRLTIGSLPAISGVTFKVEEPMLVIGWSAVTGATAYPVYIETNGVTQSYLVGVPEIKIAIPRAAIKVRIYATAGASISVPYDVSIDVSGEYKLNEVVTVPLDLSSGIYSTMGHLGANSVERPDLLGPSAITVPVTSKDSAALFAFGYNIDSLHESDFPSVPGDWFKNGWWRVSDSGFETLPVDLGRVYTGVLGASLTKTVEAHGAGASNIYDKVRGEYLDDFTEADVVDDAAMLSADLYGTTDNAATTNWQKIEPGKTVSVRWAKLIVKALKVGPLTRVRVTAGQVFVDVPDVTQSGTLTLNGVSATVELSGFNAQASAIVSANKAVNVRVQVNKTGSQPTSITITCDAGQFPVEAYYFVKGY